MRWGGVIDSQRFLNFFTIAKDSFSTLGNHPVQRVRSYAYLLKSIANAIVRSVQPWLILAKQLR